MIRAGVALIGLYVVSLSISGINSQSCPERFGRFAIPGQCDAYVECNDGVPEEKLCPDGLLFNANAKIDQYPCSYPIDVSCAQGRSQPPQPTEECPHQFAYLKMGGPSECGQFMNCVHGKAFIFDCPEGLAFSSATYRCEWPDESPDCDPESYLGFVCPPNPNEGFEPQAHREFPHPVDCQKYFICLENNKPRLLNCGEGFGYSVETRSCDARENVTSCR